MRDVTGATLCAIDSREKDEDVHLVFNRNGMVSRAGLVCVEMVLGC
jgi:hypothetical protein